MTARPGSPICLAASAGGHMTELLRLETVWRGRDHFFVTTDEETAHMLGAQARAYPVPAANRTNPLRIAAMIIACAHIIRRERPGVIITTGAAAGCIAALIGKWYGAKIVWIDTISHTEHLTLSGRIVRPFADRFYVQWPHLTERYRETIYAGTVI